MVTSVMECVFLCVWCMCVYGDKCYGVCVHVCVCEKRETDTHFISRVGEL